MNNLDIIKAYATDVWEDHNIDAIDTYFSADVIIHSPLRSVQGANEMKLIVKEWLTAIPDLITQWDDFICENNKVVARWQSRGTHQHEFRGIPASGNAIHYSGITIHELENGKIQNYWANVDLYTLTQQMAKVKSTV